VKEQPYNILSTDIDLTWQRSLLTRDAFERILVTTLGRPEGEPHQVEALYLTFAQLTYLIVNAALAPKRASRADLQAFAESFSSLLRAYEATLYTAGAPPPPPDEWLHATGAWVKDLYSAPPSRGAPKNEFEHYAYPKLLAFYQMATELTPASTPAGPTERFLFAYLEEMRVVVSASTFNKPEVEKQVRERFAIPNPDALRMKIRTFKGAAQAEVRLLDYIWRNYATALLDKAESAKGPNVH
jgi:hypothetical protein